MKKTWILTLAVIALFFGLFISGICLADDDDDVTSASIAISGESALELPFLATVSLVEAVQIAEGQVDGATWFAAIENENGFLVYDIEIVTPDGDVVDFLIDAGTGDVLEMEIDDEDFEGEEDDDDD